MMDPNMIISIEYREEGLKFEWTTAHTVNVFRLFDNQNIDAYSIGDYKNNKRKYKEFIESSKRYLMEHEFND